MTTIKSETLNDMNPSRHSSVRSNDDDKSRSTNVSASGRKPSLLARARMSFVRSTVQSGASLETLRGTTGADFEANAQVDRGHSGFCGCGGSSASSMNVIVFIKGPFCFVYKDEKAPSPKYAISLSYLKASVREASHGRFPVTLETALGDTEYEISFATKDDAGLFARVVGEQASASQKEEVRKRLGHEHLLTKRASVRYAETIAMKKVAEQPEVAVTAGEILNNVPMQHY